MCFLVVYKVQQRQPAGVHLSEVRAAVLLGSAVFTAVLRARRGGENVFKSLLAFALTFENNLMVKYRKLNKTDFSKFVQGHFRTVDPSAKIWPSRDIALLVIEV